MIGQITPLVQVAGRRIWLTAVVGHIAGATLSAAVLGLVLGTVGLLCGLDRWKLPLAVAGGAIFLACAVQDASGWWWELPSLTRQTPARLKLSFGPLWGAFAWGVDLGQGWTTRILFPGYYGLLLWIVLSAAPFQGMLVLGAYGLGRALPVLLTGLLAPRQDLITLSAVYGTRLILLQRVNATALAVTAGYILARWLRLL